MMEFKDGSADIVVGSITIVWDSSKSRWAVPGRKHTKSRVQALDLAQRLSRIVDGKKKGASL